jgi:hypothetical protein
MKKSFNKLMENPSNLFQDLSFTIFVSSFKQLIFIMKLNIRKFGIRGQRTFSLLSSISAACKLAHLYNNIYSLLE